MKGARKHELVIWEKRTVAGKRNGERSSAAFLSSVSSRFTFMFALSQFRGPDNLEAWNRLYFGRLTFKAIFTLNRIAFSVDSGVV